MRHHSGEVALIAALLIVAAFAYWLSRERPYDQTEDFGYIPN